LNPADRSAPSESGPAGRTDAGRLLTRRALWLDWRRGRVGAVDPSALPSVRRTVEMARPATWRLTLATLLGAGAIAAGIGLLATSAWLIARAATHPSVVALGVAIVGVRFFAISRGLCRYGERLVGHDAALRALADLRVRVYRRLELLAPSGLPTFRGGDLLARLVEDVDTLQDLLLRVIPPYAIALLVGIPTIGLMWFLLPAAGVILGVGLLTAAAVVPWYTGRLAKSRESRQAAVRGEMSTHVVDLLQGAAELTVFGGMPKQLERVADSDQELTRIAAATSRTSGVGSGLVTLLTGLSAWAILLVGIPSVHSGRLDGTLLAVIALIPLAAFETVVSLPAAAQSLERVRRSAARVLEVLDAEPALAEPDRPVPLGPPPYTVAIQGLRARYRPDGPWVLDGVDLALPVGRRVGIIGPSGAGKSTLAAVLLRFLPYAAGSVTLGGIALDELGGEDVRRVIGLAAQDSHVFDTTIRENLILGRREATEAEIHDALERSRLLAWVEQLPDGLDTEVGTHGASLSGGQRQRLAMARTMLAQFPVLILDEPGEHLDVATADGITRDLLDVTRGQTTVLITHRLAGLEEMDEILVLDAGRVVERGSHAQLIRRDGAYATQWQRERRQDREINIRP
jgi:thiol reductant ABC exporter CydC subunit